MLWKHITSLVHFFPSFERLMIVLGPSSLEVSIARDEVRHHPISVTALVTGQEAA